MDQDTDSESEMLSSVEWGVFASDFHLFSNRSRAEQTIQTLRGLDHSPNNCIVLGGDIFDFRWSRLGSHRATTAAAIIWLEQLLQDVSPTQIVFLPGNHDSFPPFLEQLGSLAKEYPQFHWRPHTLQLGTNLFLHGDCIDAGGFHALPQYRNRFHDGKPHGTAADILYDASVFVRAHKLIPAIARRPLPTCRRLHYHLNRSPIDESEIKSVYFGHTHSAIDGLPIGAIKYYNPGASLRFMKSQIRQFRVKK